MLILKILEILEMTRPNLLLTSQLSYTEKECGEYYQTEIQKVQKEIQIVSMQGRKKAF